MGLFDLIDKKEKTIEEGTVEEVKVETPVVEVKKEVKAKKEKVAKPKENKETDLKEKKYLYPFRLYSNDHYYEIDHIFEEGKEYSFKEIAKAMLEHKFYEFDGELVEAYIKTDNVLTFTQKQYKKG